MVHVPYFRNCECRDDGGRGTGQGMFRFSPGLTSAALASYRPSRGF